VTRKYFWMTSCLLLCVLMGLGMVLAQEPFNKKSLPFSSARHAGETIYLSGEIPVKPDGTFQQGDTSAQTRQTMENLSRTLKQNGCTFDDVVKVTVYLKSMEDYQEMNSVYRTYFSGSFPARECVGGLEIAFGSDLEISAIAHKAR
jgi:2-iminobutanoate/2-iminopropanoate deaminase